MPTRYEDEKQEAVRSLQESADRAIEEYHRNPFTTKDIVMDILFFFVTAVLAFGWMLLMLLIVSFVSLSYLHFEIKTMILVSVIFAAVISVLYIWGKIKKYKQKA